MESYKLGYMGHMQLASPTLSLVARPTSSLLASGAHDGCGRLKTDGVDAVILGMLFNVMCCGHRISKTSMRLSR